MAQQWPDNQRDREAGGINNNVAWLAYGSNNQVVAWERRSPRSLIIFLWQHRYLDDILLAIHTYTKTEKRHARARPEVAINVCLVAGERRDMGRGQARSPYLSSSPAPWGEKGRSFLYNQPHTHASWVIHHYYPFHSYILTDCSRIPFLTFRQCSHSRPDAHPQTGWCLPIDPIISLYIFIPSLIIDDDDLAISFVVGWPGLGLRTQAPPLLSPCLSP